MEWHPKEVKKHKQVEANEVTLPRKLCDDVINKKKWNEEIYSPQESHVHTNEKKYMNEIHIMYNFSSAQGYF